MVIDTSAIVAILRQEPEAGAFAASIAEASERVLSVGSFLECSLVMGARNGLPGMRALDRLLARIGARLEPVTEEQARVGRAGFLRYGKGRHPAGLNFGDCYAYALAIVRDDRLLFKGRDFSQTDVQPAAQ